MTVITEMDGDTGLRILPGGADGGTEDTTASAPQVAEIARRMGESAPPPQRALLQLLSDLGVEPRDFVVAYQLADAIAGQSEKFNKMVQHCRRDFSEASVHQARVHCRRLMARLILAKEVLSTSTLDPVLRSLKRFLKPLGALRDVQVQKLALTEELSRFPEVAGLWIELGNREQRLIQAASEWVTGFRLSRIGKRLESLVGELRDPAARLAAKAQLHDSVVRALKRAYLVVMRYRRAINPSVPSTVHRVRIVYKKYRYMVESLPPAVSRPSSLQLSAMGNYQTLLGKIQDVEVLKGFVETYGQRFPVAAVGLERFHDALLERRRVLILEYVDMADTFESFWPLSSPPPELSESPIASVG